MPSGVLGRIYSGRPPARHLPNAAKRGRGEGRVRGGDICPLREIKPSGALGRIYSGRPPRATFQAPPSAAEDRGGSAGGTSVPPAQLSVLLLLRWRCFHVRNTDLVAATNLGRIQGLGWPFAEARKKRSFRRGPHGRARPELPHARDRVRG